MNSSEQCFQLIIIANSVFQLYMLDFLMQWSLNQRCDSCWLKGYRILIRNDSPPVLLLVFVLLRKEQKSWNFLVEIEKSCQSLEIKMEKG